MFAFLHHTTASYSSSRVPVLPLTVRESQVVSHIVTPKGKGKGKQKCVHQLIKQRSRAGRAILAPSLGHYTAQARPLSLLGLRLR